MIVAPPPENERTRLDELYSLDILDTLPEEAYDAITLLASQICDVPIALISIVDSDRQWFKSRVGLDAAETPRDLAFCAHAIRDPDAILVVPDATEDPRFSGSPLVTGDPNIRFYAGSPLVTAAGHALGTLCVIDRTARELTAEQRAALEALSVQVMALLELRRTVDELNDKQAALEAMMRERETFLATVSHEIRTPLSAVVGYVELLRDPSAVIGDDDREQLISTVAHQAGDVARLIDDLLVAANAESDSLEVQRVSVDLGAQVAQVVEVIDASLAEVVRISDPPVRALGDPARVRQVVRNLITNARRYGGPQVEILLRRSGDTCVLEVSDNGAGVPDADAERIFEAYQRASEGRTASESVGLGLPISRLLAERMGGSLTYERRGERTVFRLELSAVASATARHQEPDAA